VSGGKMTNQEENFKNNIVRSWAEQDDERLLFLEELTIDGLENERKNLLDSLKKINNFSESEISVLRRSHYDNDVFPKMNIKGGRYQHRATFIYEAAIKPVIDKNPTAKILNVGCGSGCLNFFFWIYERDLPLENCTAVADVVPSFLLPHALYDITPYLVHFEKEDLNNFVDDKFDLIICSEVIEHVNQKSENMLINSFKGLLNPGGNLCLTYPSPEHCHLDDNPLGHKRVPSAEKIKDELGGFFDQYVEGNFRDMESCRKEHPLTPSFCQIFSDFKKL
jgi:2-polyprenyl-3-methyl-5-hydroxy-6-metoxy-1,4-benzoquinol methylase